MLAISQAEHLRIPVDEGADIATVAKNRNTGTYAALWPDGHCGIADRRDWFITSARPLAQAKVHWLGSRTIDQAQEGFAAFWESFNK